MHIIQGDQLYDIKREMIYLSKTQVIVGQHNTSMYIDSYNIIKSNTFYDYVNESLILPEESYNKQILFKERYFCVKSGKFCKDYSANITSIEVNPLGISNDDDIYIVEYDTNMLTTYISVVDICNMFIQYYDKLVLPDDILSVKQWITKLQENNEEFNKLKIYTDFYNIYLNNNKYLADIFKTDECFEKFVDTISSVSRHLVNKYYLKKILSVKEFIDEFKNGHDSNNITIDLPNDSRNMEEYMKWISVKILNTKNANILFKMPQSEIKYICDKNRSDFDLTYNFL